jgi:hypothetical protein
MQGRVRFGDMTRLDGDGRFTPKGDIMVMKDGKGRKICRVPQAHFDNLRAQWFLDCVDSKWRLNESGKAVARR